MANKNFDPNARYDTGPAAAGTGRVSTTAYQAGDVTVNGTFGETTDSTLIGTDIRCGFSAAGNIRVNTGPNVAGAPRSINGV